MEDHSGNGGGSGSNNVSPNRSGGELQITMNGATG